MYISDEEVKKNGYKIKGRFLYCKDEKVFIITSGEANGINIEKIDLNLENKFKE